VSQKRPALFRGRHLEDVIIVLCVRLVFAMFAQLQGLEEIMAERGMSVDHVTIIL
jgi:transposase-like protein